MSAIAQKTILVFDRTVTIHFLVQVFQDMVWVVVTANGKPGTVLLSSTAQASGTSGMMMFMGGGMGEDPLAGDGEERRAFGGVGGGGGVEAEMASAGIQGGTGPFIPEEAVTEEGAGALIGEQLVDVDTLLGNRDEPLTNICSTAISSGFVRFGFHQQCVLSLSIACIAEAIPPEERMPFVRAIVSNVLSLAGEALKGM